MNEKIEWEQQLNMADDAVIGAALQRAGLDAAALLAASQQPEVKERLLQIHEQIAQRWQNALANEASGQLGRDYLAKRGVPLRAFDFAEQLRRELRAAMHMRGGVFRAGAFGVLAFLQIARVVQQNPDDAKLEQPFGQGRLGLGAMARVQ